MESIVLNLEFKSNSRSSANSWGIFNVNSPARTQQYNNKTYGFPESFYPPS